MRVQLLVRVAGPMGNYPPGARANIPDNIAKALIERGLATSLERPKPAPVEVAAVEPPEKAVARKPKPRKYTKKADEE